MPDETKKISQINIGVHDGEEFFAHELTVNFNPTQFIMDFRCVTPRNDPRGKEAPFVSIRHNVVLVDPYHAKRILDVMNSVISQYEERFGKIEKPKALDKFEKEVLKDSEKFSKKSTKETIPNYFG